MKADRRLERAYENLTANERFRLVVAAEARSDDADVDRLLRSCPVVTQRLNDPAFSDRLECAFELTTAIVATLFTVTRNLDGVEAVGQAAKIFFLAAADEAESEAFRITGTLQPSIRHVGIPVRRRFARLLRRLRTTLHTEGASIAHAFANFCHDELELDPREMLTAVDPETVALFDRFVGFSPDADQVESIRSQLSRRLAERIDD